LRTQRVQLRAVTHNVLTAGDGEPVLLLHGWPETLHAWRGVVPLLADRYSVIAPDLLGFGASSKPTSGYDKKTVATHLRELVRHLGHERLRIVGHDLGGQVAWTYAALWPDEVQQLVLLECAIPRITQPSLPDLTSGSWHFSFNMLADLPEALITGRERTFVRYLLFRDRVGASNTAAITEPDIDAYVTALSAPGGLRGSLAHYRALPQDFADNQDLAAQPPDVLTLAIAGADGYGTSWLKSAAHASSRLQTALIADSGHYIPEEQPEALSKLIRDFFMIDS
jgi:pimeloyl-ACP methyl ester carboxylesterase